MQIETGPIPTADYRRGRHGKYGELWTALEATGGKSALIVKGLTALEVQQVRVASRFFVRNKIGFKVATRYTNGDLILWLTDAGVPHPGVSRTLSAIR